MTQSLDNAKVEETSKNDVCLAFQATLEGVWVDLGGRVFKVRVGAEVPCQVVALSVLRE